jgi:hypothetical protein
MHILELRVNDVKRISVVEVRPDSPLVQIAGKNRQGKTSLLNSIGFALGGARMIQSQPIRSGHDEGSIVLDLGAYKVTRTFRRKGDDEFTTTLKVEAADGRRIDKQQDLLNTFLGDFTFEPLKFLKMAPKDQMVACRAFVPGVDFDAIEVANKKDFAERTDVNRRKDELQTRADAIRLPAGAVPAVVDLLALEDALERAGQTNADIAQRQSARTNADARIAQIDAEIARLTEEKTGLQQRLAAAPALPAPVDTTAIREQIAAGRQANETARLAAQRSELLEQAKAAAKQSADLTEAMKKRTADAAKAVAAAKMPIPGLGFGDGFVTLDGQPFDQGSDAEQLRASIAIAAAMHPKLKVICVREGSCIDSDGMKALAAYAEENDLQIWIEVIEATDGAGPAFIMEDGHLKGHAPPAEAALEAQDYGEAI